MNRTFRLATVERLRAARLDEAGTALQRAADAVEAATQHRDDLTRRLREPDPATPTGLVQGAVARERMRAERVRAAEEVDRLAGELAAARQAWLHARAQLKAVETLHAAHRRAVAEADARAEQRALDEIAGLRASRALLDGGAA